MMIEDEQIKADKAKLKYVQTLDEAHLEKANKHEIHALSLFGTKNLDSSNPHNDVEVQRRRFANLCVAIEDNGYNDVDKMSIRKFYSTIYYLEDKARKQKARMNRNK